MSADSDADAAQFVRSHFLSALRARDGVGADDGDDNQSTNTTTNTTTNTNAITIAQIGIVCGSGLSGLVENLDNSPPIISLPYKDIPGFPETTVVGHSGELVLGRLKGLSVCLMKGRFHSYEGHEMRVTGMPIRVFKALGVHSLIVTNAAGGINQKFNVGDVMCINDHIGFPLLAGKHPLLGPNLESDGPRFVPMSNAYDAVYRKLFSEVAHRYGASSYYHDRGTYCMVSGPTYETSAECALLDKIGADAVGMSTVPEVVVARHCGMRVLGISLITNKVVFPGDTQSAPASHEEVIETTTLRAADMQQLVKMFIGELGSEDWPKKEEQLANALNESSRMPSGMPSMSTSRSRDPLVQLQRELQQLDISNITPLQALTELQKLKRLSTFSTT